MSEKERIMNKKFEGFNNTGFTYDELFSIEVALQSLIKNERAELLASELNDPTLDNDDYKPHAGTEAIETALNAHAALLEKVRTAMKDGYEAV